MDKKAVLNTKLAVKLQKQRELVRAPGFFSDIMDIGDDIYNPYKSSDVVDK